MPVHTLRLPPVVYDDGIALLLNSLSGLTQIPAEDECVLDFQDLRFYEPGALTAVLACIHSMLGRNREVRLLNSEVCPAFTYLQRMDFFRCCGITLPEHFRRREATGRFVPLETIASHTVGDVDRLAQSTAACLFPALADSDDPTQTGPFDHVTYAVTELVNNVLQHARAPGLLMAQSYPKSGQVCVAIADHGIGIRNSFAETAPDFWDPAMSELDAVRLALQPKISSKLHVASGWGKAVNAGVGLSILKELAAVADGCFTLASGAGLYQWNHRDHREYPTETLLPAKFPGTLCAIQVSQQKLLNHFELLHAAKQNLHLLGQSGGFDDLFES